MKRKYKVTGTHEGKEINEEVEAYSKSQAKMKAGFSSGFGGGRMKSFLKNKSINVREVKWRNKLKKY